jgi:hypothetical protein
MARRQRAADSGAVAHLGVADAADSLIESPQLTENLLVTGQLVERGHRSDAYLAGGVVDRDLAEAGDVTEVDQHRRGRPTGLHVGHQVVASRQQPGPRVLAEQGQRLVEAGRRRVGE